MVAARYLVVTARYCSLLGYYVDWFNNEIAEAIKTREKYLKKFKKSNLQIDYNFYIKAKYNTHKLIKQKKN